MPAHPPLTSIINAWGTPTPFGVSRSSATVAQIAALALQRHADIDELAAQVAGRVLQITGTQAAWFCHCSAAGITLAAAGALAGADPAAVAALPRRDEAGVIAIQQEHCVNYGQPIEQAIRLSGAHVRQLEGPAAQRWAQLEALAREGTLRGIVYVESSLTKRPAALMRGALSEFARRHGAWLIVDAAAQDWRMNDRQALAEADVTIFSAQKYLAAPTCGIAAGTAPAIGAMRAHLAGIGRAMKPTKEALAGLWQALAERDWSALPVLRERNIARARRFADALRQGAVAWPRISVAEDDVYGPYPRIFLDYGPNASAAEVADRLMNGEPRIAVGRGHLDRNALTLELTFVSPEEESHLLHRLRDAHADAGVGGR